MPFEKISICFENPTSNPIKTNPYATFLWLSNNIFLLWV